MAGTKKNQARGNRQKKVAAETFIRMAKDARERIEKLKALEQEHTAGGAGGYPYRLRIDVLADFAEMNEKEAATQRGMR